MDTNKSAFHLKTIALGFYQYMQDNDGRFPPAATWADGIWPYIKSEQQFHDPAAPNGQKWGYAFNSDLSGIALADIASPATTVLAFESTIGLKNSADAGRSVPRPGRHSGGTHHAFADGHVEWFLDDPDGAGLRYS